MKHDHQPQRNYRGRRGKRWNNRRSGKGAFAAQMAGVAVVAGIAAFGAAPEIKSQWALATKTPEEIAAIEASAYYPNCDAARAAGVAPIYRGQPGYREGMDGDLDGEACEPYRGR